MRFYDRPEWRQIRYRVLRKLGWKCRSCGLTPKDGRKIHVDHIHPISTHPELALDENNLQPLCDLCNLGKSNLYADDLRPVAESTPEQDDCELKRLSKTLSERIELEQDTSKRDRLMQIFMAFQRERYSGKTKEAILKAVRGLIEMELGEVRHA